MAVKQVEILRLRQMTKKLEHELQSTSRRVNSNEQRLNPALALADNTDHQSQTGTKRSASAAAFRSESHDRAHIVPRIYEGKSLRGLRAWTADVEDHFARLGAPVESDAARVDHALKHVASNIQQEWQNYEQNRGDAGQCSWKGFIEFLANLFGNPEERKMMAMQAYHDAMPRPNESVERFKAYLESLEAELPPYTEEQRALHLQLRLRLAAQKQSPGQNKSSHNGAPSKKDPGQNRAAQWSARRGPRGLRGGHPSHNRGGRNAHPGPKGKGSSLNRGGQNVGPRRPYPDHEDKTYGQAGAKRQRHVALDHDIKQEPDDSLESLNQAFQ
ncbi:MAG: hypothetical protein L6R42_004582 [Xanthoria sp. 1 TBL-2021]|nr:MAG: hypothetical protein L6R42_004582 [Xanthoria sp. 1 TBL-2021]